jgi:hypothetical protein
MPNISGIFSINTQAGPALGVGRLFLCLLFQEKEGKKSLSYCYIMIVGYHISIFAREFGRVIERDTI